MMWAYDDGGREAAGYRGQAGDCVCRAVAIASGLPYREVYKRLAEGNASQRSSKRDRGPRQRSARNGINTRRKWFKDYMAELGAIWHPTAQIGLGAAPIEFALPKEGRLAVKFRRHYAAVIDGVIRDTFDPTGERKNRCPVFGYWQFPPREA